MSLQEDLMLLGNREAGMLSDMQINNKIEQTITTTFSRMAGLLLIAFGVAFGMSSGFISIPLTGIGYLISTLGGFGLIMRVSRRRQTMSKQTISAILLIFAALEGYGLSGVFAMYGLGSVQQAFLTTTLLFGGLAVAGKYMNVDVTKVGSILSISLISLLVAMLINMFWMNETFNIWISIIGIVIFSGMVIYDMNVLKQQALSTDERIPLMMSLSMFLNFINLFLFILRLTGGSRE